jgi:M6 family metalloprotease-like protein
VKNPNTLASNKPALFISLLSRAIFVALSLATCLANPTATLAQKVSTQEKRVEGELEVIYEDAHPEGRLLYFLHANGKKLSLHFAVDPPTMLHTGMRVEVRGVQVGETLELNSGDSLSPASGAPAVSGNPMGQHRVLVIMVNFQDKQTQPFTQELAQSVMFTTTSDFYREASYDQTWLTGDVYGWFTIPVSYTTCDTTAIADFAKQAAVAAGANLSAYDHYVYAFPQNACTWQGRASVGGAPSEAWINEWFELGIVGHELGHNFGLYHSRSMDCGAASIGTNCTTSEYGDTLDLMGAANSAHFNLFQKERLGWTNSGSSPPITTVTSSGTYWLDAYEQVSMNPKGLKILKSTDPVTGMKTWYYIEHRAAFGFDSFLSGNTNVLNGVVIRTGSDSSGQSTYLLDMTPSSASWYDPALTVGQSFNDADAGVSVTTLAADRTGALVGVSVSQPCVRSNPTLNLSPSKSPWVSSGSTVSFNVTVRNNDSGGCGGSVFSLQAAAPVNWVAAFGSPSPIIDQGSTATTTLQITSPAGAADGFYGINVGAANSSSPANASSASVTYSLVSALAVTATATQTSYMRNQTATVNATVKAGGTALSGATVTFTMTKSNGTVVTNTAITAANGVAVFQYAFNRKKDPAGSYQVRAQAASSNAVGSGVVTFAVK